MLSQALFWFVVTVFVVGQAILVRSAWQLRKREASPPPEQLGSRGSAGLMWTVVTAGLTGFLLYYAYLALP